MKLGLFGGTFNPPHAGHVALARSAVRELRLSRLLLMPAFLPPHKNLPRDTASTEERYEMASIAASLVPRCEASRLELDRGDRSYTSDTLLELHELYPKAGIVLLVGGDMLMTLDRWHESETIFRLASVAAAARDEDEFPRLQEKKRDLEERCGARVVLLSHRVVPVSSSGIREQIAAGEETPFLPPEIAAYIRERGLYR